MIKKIILLAIMVAVIAAFFMFDLGQYLNFQYLKSQQNQFAQYYNENKVLLFLFIQGYIYWLPCYLYREQPL